MNYQKLIKKINKEFICYIGLPSLVINILSLIFPLFLLQIYDRIIPQTAYESLTLLAIAVVSALMIETGLKIGRARVNAWADARKHHQLSCQLFDKILNADLNAYERASSGTHLENILSFTKTHDFYGNQAATSLLDLPFILLFLLLILYIGGVIVLIPLCFIIVAILLIMRASETLQTLLTHIRHSNDIKTNFLIGTLRGIHTIKSASMENLLFRRFERLQKENAAADYQLNQQSSNLFIKINFLSQLSVVITVFIGSLLVINNQLTIGALAACTLLNTRSLQPLIQAILVWRRLQNIIIAQHRLEEIENLPSEYIKGNLQPAEIKGDIRLSNITLVKQKHRYALQDINLHVLPGETVAVTGKSLAGKTLLLHTILGIIQPIKGQIHIDDKLINDYNIQHLRQQIAFITNNDSLFKGTILENVTLFNNKLAEHAKYLLSELRLDYFINRMPAGYDTPVGDIMGDYMPRGIKQRICIARALINNPKIILFDQGSAMIDKYSDTVLRKFLARLKGKHTIIIVSHRPSMLELADKIYKLENGKLSL
ncbi:MAG: ABC transporter transmembrane domain-containing protein [Gammaproteobacteria bacterium]